MAKPNRPITADALIAGANARTKQPGTNAWIDTHPHRDAIVAAVKAGVRKSDLLAELRSLKVEGVTLARLKTVYYRVQEGTL